MFNLKFEWLIDTPAFQHEECHMTIKKTRSPSYKFFFGRKSRRARPFTNVHRKANKKAVRSGRFEKWKYWLQLVNIFGQLEHKFWHKTTWIRFRILTLAPLENIASVTPAIVVKSVRIGKLTLEWACSQAHQPDWVYQARLFPVKAWPAYRSIWGVPAASQALFSIHHSASSLVLQPFRLLPFRFIQELFELLRMEVRDPDTAAVTAKKCIKSRHMSWECTLV